MERTLSSLVRGKIVDSDDEVVVLDLNEIAADRVRFWTGLGLAVTSCLFIGGSFVIKKLALLRLGQTGQARAGSGGYGYLRDWLWWAGLVTMGLGEAFNFTAYAMAPASLVTPLGALSVLISAVLASKYLNESLNLLGKIGCVLCIMGSTVIVIHAPKEAKVDTLEEIGSMLTQASFLVYVSFVALTVFLLMAVYAPRYGNSNLLIYILICSMVGSLTVMACKGLGLAIRETLDGKANQLTNGLFWIFLFSVVGCITVQMNYLNKALDVFSTSLVTPVYYVFFTTFVLIASSVLFKEWYFMSAEDVIGSLCGFFTVVTAIFLLNGFKDYSISLESLWKTWYQAKVTSSSSSGGQATSQTLILDTYGDEATRNSYKSSGRKNLTKKRKKKPNFSRNHSDDGVRENLMESDSSSQESNYGRNYNRV